MAGGVHGVSAFLCAACCWCCVVHESDSWLRYLLGCFTVFPLVIFDFFKSERSTVKSSTCLWFSIEKILQTFFLWPLVFNRCILSCSSFKLFKNLTYMCRNRFIYEPLEKVYFGAIQMVLKK